MSKRTKTSNSKVINTEDSKDIISTQKTIEEKYQKKTQKEHILLRPDTYIGDISLQTESLWVYDRNNKKIIKKDISYVPGLYKIFDEILVNARDHTVNDHTCDTIRVDINQENNEISVTNNGKGIDIEMHQEHNMWVPEMIFGELLTSTNYDDNEKRTTGGRNGYGAKLTNIFSIYFQVETVDLVRKRKFVQEWTNNMNNKSQPKITELKGDNIKSYTKITFRPDLTKFKLKELTDDMVSLMEKRVIDVAGVSGKIKVYLNGTKLDINNFKKYISFYDIPQLPTEFINDDQQDDDNLQITENSESKKDNDRIMYEEYGRWRIGIIYTPDNGFEQISFVNGICTYHGGSHVDYIVNNIVKKLETMILKKSKDAKIKPNQIKDNLMIFLDCIVENPAFTSQTKETLKTKISDFGSTCDITDKFVKKIGASGIVDQVVNLAMMKEQAILKKTDGKKVQSLKGVPKLEDAEWAGTKKSELCYLILTEGDSAKAMAMAGRDVIGSERFGIFPLKGKLLNVREASPKQLLENEEITNLKKILGLQHEKEYTDTSALRYCGVVVLTDQDSVTADTPILLKKDNILDIKTIDKIGTEWEKDIFNNKDIGKSDYEVWTNNGWTKIKKVIKHTVNKRIYRVLTHTGLVDVTEDHSLLDMKAEKISPKDIKVGEELLHEPLYFNDFKVDIPDNLNNINVRELWQIAIKLKIRFYQSIKKDNLINIINSYKNKYYHVYNNNTYNITKEEAYVMGLFFADGTCGTYEWKYEYKNKNRPKAYTYNRTSISWAISNTNLDYLNKAKDVLTNIYGYEFKIIECSYKGTFNSTKQHYKLIVNGNTAVKDFVDKYRNLFYEHFDTETKAEKRIPIEILNNTLENRQEFFNGFYDGDGAKTSECKFMDVNSKITSQGIFMLCRSLGYEVSINHNIKKPTVYVITITKGRLQTDPNIIKKIYDLGIKETVVYDLETENHHFQAGIGSMIVHNTDGSHIKGLLLNFLHYFWPSLMKLGTFIYSLATPIIKATKNKEIKTFYNLTEYDRWKQETQNVKSWSIKYYKGLGTSDRNEAKEYFTDIDNKLVRYVASVLLDQQIDEVNEDEELNEEIKEESVIDFNKITELSQTQTFKIKEKYKDPCDEAITLAFEKKRADDRKIWLLNYNKNNILYNDQKLVTINEFVNKELIHFSNDDINRSIPSVVDGFKPSTRKILYGSILRKLFNKKDEIKVSQLAGFVSDKSCYHHGEASLIGAIVGMAQNFVGSNNINILYPSGQFGTRMTSKDFASPRYIFTYLAELTRLIFRPEDEPILNYLDDDGTYVEPEYYVPIIPMILVNGGEGIGTGFSTYIPCYDPLKIIDNLINMMDKKELERMKPYYRNFKGSIDLVSDKEFKITGNFNVIGEDEIEITELPIGLWTSPYKQFIEELYDKKQLIADFNSASCTDEKISIKIKLFDGLLEKMECNGTLMSKLKLISRENTSNMHLYNSSGQIRKYHNPESILKEFYDVRLNYYTKRKEYLIGKLNKELNILKYKVMFIEYVLDKKIIIERQKKVNIINKLIELKFPKLADSNDDESYDYLTEMSLFSLTEDKIDELNKRFKNKEDELKKVQLTSEIDQWKYELNEFKDEYMKWIDKHKIDYSKQPLTKTKSKLMSKTIEEPTTKKRVVKKPLIKK